MGQADGIACRSVEMFEAFGIAPQLLERATGSTRTVFWSPDPDNRAEIRRSGRIRDVEDGLSEFPHVIVNQARIHQYLLESMRVSERRLTPDFGIEVVDLVVEHDEEYPVAVRIVRPGRPIRPPSASSGRSTSSAATARGARFAARSAGACRATRRTRPGASSTCCRRLISRHPIQGGRPVLRRREQRDDPARGRLPRAVHIEMDKLAPDERVTQRAITADTVLASANRIFHPYRIAAKEVVWWSVYEIGPADHRSVRRRRRGRRARATGLHRR